MTVLKEKGLVVFIAILLLFSISLIENISTSAEENAESTTVQSIVGITFTDKESPVQDRPEEGSDNQNLGGGEYSSSKHNQNGKSIFPQTGEKSTITLIVMGLLMILLVVVTVVIKIKIMERG